MNERIEYLRKKLSGFTQRVDMRYSEYDMKYNRIDPGVTIPDKVRMLYKATLGWCTKSVDSLADRLSFKGFENDVF